LIRLVRLVDGDDLVDGCSPGVVAVRWRGKLGRRVDGSVVPRRGGRRYRRSWGGLEIVEEDRLVVWFVCPRTLLRYLAVPFIRPVEEVREEDLLSFLLCRCLDFLRGSLASTDSSREPSFAR
jgi:hypothetical protein